MLSPKLNWITKEAKGMSPLFFVFLGITLSLETSVQFAKIREEVGNSVT